MKRLVLPVTEDDILASVRFRIGNPILFVLQRATRTLWRMNDDGLLVEVMAPYRICKLSPEALAWWHEYSQRDGTGDDAGESDSDGLESGVDNCGIEIHILSGAFQQYFATHSFEARSFESRALGLISGREESESAVDDTPPVEYRTAS